MVMPWRSASLTRRVMSRLLGMKRVLGNSCLCARPSFSRRLASIFDGSAALAGTGAELRMKQLAASMSAMKLKSPSDSVEMGASFNLKTIQASLT